MLFLVIFLPWPALVQRDNLVMLFSKHLPDMFRRRINSRWTVAFTSEIITPARVRNGETFRFDYFNSATQVYWELQRIIYACWKLARREIIDTSGNYLKKSVIQASI